LDDVLVDALDDFLDDLDLLDGIFDLLDDVNLFHDDSRVGPVDIHFVDDGVALNCALDHLRFNGFDGDFNFVDSHHGDVDVINDDLRGALGVEVGAAVVEADALLVAVARVDVLLVASGGV
jgi:hypothetical protein